MLTTDLALRLDPEYEQISRRFHADLDEFRLAFAKAWYKLLHRDMGPITRYLGPWSPSRSCGRTRSRRTRARWSPTPTSPTSRPRSSTSGLGVDQLVRTAWASAASFRDTDKRGGANGARIRLEPQKDWEVNEPAELAGVLEKLEQVRSEFNGAGGAQVSLADLIVLRAPRRSRRRPRTPATT